MNDGLELLLGMFTFDETEQNVYVNFYSTIRDQFYNYQNQFVYSFRGNTGLVSAAYDPSLPAPDRAALLSGFVSAPAAQQEDTKPRGTALLLTLAATGLAAAAAALVIARRKGK